MLEIIKYKNLKEDVKDGIVLQLTVECILNDVTLDLTITNTGDIITSKPVEEDILDKVRYGMLLELENRQSIVSRTIEIKKILGKT